MRGPGVSSPAGATSESSITVGCTSATIETAVAEMDSSVASGCTAASSARACIASSKTKGQGQNDRIRGLALNKLMSGSIDPGPRDAKTLRLAMGTAVPRTVAPALTRVTAVPPDISIGPSNAETT